MQGDPCTLPDYALETGGGRVVLSATSRYCTACGPCRGPGHELTVRFAAACRTYQQTTLQALLGVFPGNPPSVILQVSH